MFGDIAPIGGGTTTSLTTSTHDSLEPHRNIQLSSGSLIGFWRSSPGW